jgi:hypothetical protein
MDHIEKGFFLAIRSLFYVSFTQIIMAATAAMLLKFICIILILM